MKTVFVSEQQLYVLRCAYTAYMSVVFNAMTTSQLKRVNNYIFTDIVRGSRKRLHYRRWHPNGSWSLSLFSH